MADHCSFIRGAWLFLGVAAMATGLWASDSPCDRYLQIESRASDTCKPLIRLWQQPICEPSLNGDDAESRVEEVTRLLQQQMLFEYADRHQLNPGSEELDWWRRSMSKGFEDGEITPERLALMDRMGCSTIVNWKVGQALHGEYGGRVLLSSFGMHVPMDAWYQYLRHLHEKGDLVFVDPGLEDGVWQRLQQDDWSDGVVEEDEGRELFADPPWLASDEDLEEP